MRANAALHNIVFSQPDQGLARKEMRVLHVLEQIRAYCETCWDWLQARDGGPEGGGTGAGECASWAPRGQGSTLWCQGPLASPGHLLCAWCWLRSHGNL